MSSLIGKFLTILGLKRREANILVVGLDNSGKSTILNYLKRKEDQVEEVVPTVGFTVERLSGLAARTGGSSAKAGLSLTAFDMSGQGRYRNLWEHYYGNVEGIIFVVDSTDALRLVVARDELEMMLKHQQLQIEAEDGGGPVLGTQNGSLDGNGGEDEEEEDGNTAEDVQKKGAEKAANGKLSTATSRLASKNNRKTFTRTNTSTSSTSSTSSPKNAKSALKSSASNSSLGSSSSTQPSGLALPPPNATFRRADIPILFFANKMDLKDALPSVKISQMLGLTAFPHKNWHIQASNAITGEGVPDGIEWLVYQIASNKNSSSKSGGGGRNSAANNASSSSIPSSASSNSLSSSK